jgi:hypothetical protein
MRAAQLGFQNYTNYHIDYRDNLARYFASTSDEYKTNHLRMDDMLDNQQESSGFFQRRTMALGLTVNTMLSQLGSTTSTNPATSAAGTSSNSASTTGSQSSPSNSPPETTAAPSTATAPIAAYYATAANVLSNILDKQLAAPVSDSPFDSLDRVSDFYASFLLKFLRQEGSSLINDPDALVIYLKNQTQWEIDHSGITNEYMTNNPYAKKPTKIPAYRVIYLYFQVSVKAGTKANYMTGLRVRLSDSDRSNGVKILRVLPSRDYDLDSVAYGDSQNYTTSLGGGGNVGSTSATVKGNKDSSVEGEERQRFMNRVGKMSGFVDGASGVFGWDFYPSNQHVRRLHLLKILWNLLAFAPRLYETDSYLDGGGRDCLVYLLVPYNQHGNINQPYTSITATVYSYYASFNPDGHSSGDSYSYEKTPWRESNNLKIEIPKGSPYEQVASLPVSFPKEIPTTPAFTIITQGLMQKAIEQIQQNSKAK